MDVPRPAEPLRRPIPSTGEELPVVGLGTWRVFDVGGAGEREPLRRVLARFVELGGRLVDASPMYGRAEQVVGELAGELDLREALFLATKVWISGRAEGVAQMERSEGLLGRRLDLLQVHNLLDAEAHLATLREWKEQGRVRYLGITHYTASAHPEVERWLRRERLDFVQINYSLLEPEAERRVLPLAAERGVAVLANRPLGSGALLRRLAGRPLPEWAAAELGCHSWAQLALAWVVGHPAVTCALPATGDPRHLEQDLAVLRSPLPDAEQRRRIAAAVGAG